MTQIQAPRSYLFHSWDWWRIVFMLFFFSFLFMLEEHMYENTNFRCLYIFFASLETWKNSWMLLWMEELCRIRLNIHPFFDPFQTMGLGKYFSTQILYTDGDQAHSPTQYCCRTENWLMLTGRIPTREHSCIFGKEYNALISSNCVLFQEIQCLNIKQLRTFPGLTLYFLQRLYLGLQLS